MQDRQHRAVGDRIEEFVGLPSGRERPGFGLAVADDAGDDQAGIVEGGAEGVAQRIAEFAALVNRARRRGRDVAGNASGERKLLEQPFHPGFVLTDVGIDLAVAALKIGVGDQGGTAVPGSGDVDHVEIVQLDGSIEMNVDEILPRRRAPMPDHQRFDVSQLQRLAQHRIVVEIDLTDREIVGRAPIGVHQAQFRRVQARLALGESRGVRLRVSALGGI